MSENIVNEQEERSVSNIDDFKEVVDIAKKLLDRKKLTIKITSSLRFGLTVDETALKEELDSAKINPDTFKRILESEISDMLSVVLSEDEKSYLKFVLRDLKDNDREARRELTKSKLDIIKKIIIGEKNEGIKARYLVLSTSKQDFFDDISWEINEKQYASGRELDPLRYATLKFQFKRNPIFRLIHSGLPILLQNENAYSAAFDCDVTQIDDLISVLEDVKKKLQHKEEKNEP
jgi:hypothetical protein